MTEIRGCFVTGTDTGVGKTRVALGIMTALRRQNFVVAGMKPVASGCVLTENGRRNDDALLLQTHSSLELDYQAVNPFAFEPAVAPHIAAREVGVAIDVNVIRKRLDDLMSRVDFVVVEGVGGWRVPLGGGTDVAAMARQIGLPVVLVVGLRLGCINHALLTAEAMAADGVTLAGWVANQLEADYARLKETIETLSPRLSAPLLGVLPWASGAPLDEFADRLEAGVFSLKTTNG